MSGCSITNTPLHTGKVQWLGEGISYDWAWELQRDLASRRAGDGIPDTLLLLTHAPVYTAGRRFVEAHILQDLQAPLIETDRGGQVTYHGPGQLVGYPIVMLSDLAMGPKRYVEAIENGLITALGKFGIIAYRESGLTGVWTSAGKVGAIGVKISRGVTTHGFALNIFTDLRAYDAIVPCGIEDRSVTSMSEILRAPMDLGEIAHSVSEELGRELGIDWRWS